MLDGIPIVDLTASAILGVGVLALMFGRIVPRYFYTEKKDEAEKWRLAFEAEREARQTADEQTSELLEITKTTKSFITAVFDNSERIRVSGESDVGT